MMAVRYHGCTCHLRYSAAANQNQNQNSVKKGSDNSNTSGKNLFLYGQFSIQSIIDFWTPNEQSNFKGKNTSMTLFEIATVKTA